MNQTSDILWVQYDYTVYQQYIVRRDQGWIFLIVFSHDKVMVFMKWTFVVLGGLYTQIDSTSELFSTYTFNVNLTLGSLLKHFIPVGTYEGEV